MYQLQIVRSVLLALTAFSIALGTTACEKQQPAAQNRAAGTGSGSGSAPPAGHADAGKDDHHGGPVIELGMSTIGPFTVKATRDQGQIVAGKDAPIDVTVTPSASARAKATAVRFWIGTEDGKGSVKAKADIEDLKEPNRWHTHAEIPSPMPAGSRLWIEIETDKGETLKGGFDLKM